MSTITGWHFADKTLRDGRPLPRKGDVLRHDGPVVPCKSGLHASESALDALGYAPGPFVARVELRGTVIPHGNPVDKHAASERHYLTGCVDASRVLHEFACWCATEALDRGEAAGRTVDPRSRAAIATKFAWLDGRATDKELAAASVAAWDAARDAARAAERAAERAAARAAASVAAWDAARDAAWDAARDAASVAAWAAAWAAARAAERAAAWDAARDAASVAAWAAARAAERAEQNAELERRLMALAEVK